MSEAKEFDPTSFEGLNRGVIGIDGLWCPSCASTVGRVMATVPGITEAQVSFAGASASLAWEKGTDLHELARKVSALGYRLTAPDTNEEKECRILDEMRRTAIRLGVAVVFGMWTLVLSILIYLNPDNVDASSVGYALAIAAGVTALPVVVWSGAPILIIGWRTARAGVPGMDSLVALGVSGAVIASLWSLFLGETAVWFDTAVMLITLLTVARLAEMETLRQSSRAIAALSSSLPETAHKFNGDGKNQDVLASDIRKGDRISVLAGERVPLDGLLVAGESRFDTSTLTGESLPRAIVAKERVEAGFINLSRKIELMVTAEMGERRIDLMGGEIAAALHTRPEIHRLADRLARIIVPLAISLASLTLFIGLIKGISGEEAALWALSVLIIACPCAVAIAAPVSHLAATRMAAESGIHFRTQAASEVLGTVKSILFDKTGTLTEGRPVIHDIKLQEHFERDRVLSLVAAAEQEIEHPVAKALCEACNTEWVATQLERFDDGVKAIVDGQKIFIGSYGFFLRNGITPHETKNPREGLTSVYVAINHVWAATFYLGDELRPDASAIISQLKKAGISVEMISGDAYGPCTYLGAQTGLDSKDIYAGCSPEEKAKLVQKRVGTTVFVGDGVNDMLAITQADVGIAATNASPVTIALADVVIARGGLSAVVDAIAISRKARRVLRQNLVFSVTYNALALGLAVSGTVPPLAAAGAMAASSLMVITNASRLRMSSAKKKRSNNGAELQNENLRVSTLN